MPRLRTAEELKSEVKFAKSWRTPGPVNSFFMAPPIPKAKILDTWTAARVDQPERVYERYMLGKPPTFRAHN